MLHKQMAERCPSSSFIGRAYLENFKFVYDGYSFSQKGPVANIVSFPGEIIWGGLYEIKEDNLATLDGYEGYPKSYDRRPVEVIDDRGQKLAAIVYLRNGLQVGSPTLAYRTKVRDGAKDCNLPEDYVNSRL